MPITRTAGPITFDSSLAAYSNPAMDNPYTENVKTATEGVPVAFNNLVQYQATSGSGTGQNIITTV